MEIETINNSISYIDFFGISKIAEHNFYLFRNVASFDYHSSSFSTESFCLFKSYPLL